MFSSAELIEALRRRARRSLRPETPPGEYPPGWQAWFASLRERMGGIVGAPADAFVALLARRPLRAPPPRLPQLSGAEAFAALWRQQWSPAARDERGQRIVAFAIAAFLQLLFSIALLWLAYARYGGEPAAQAGEDVVQVEFIGTGTPDTEGGGAAAGPAEVAAATAAPAPPGSRSAGTPASTQRPQRPATATAAASATAPPPQSEPQPEPPAATQAPAGAPATAQPVQVTETAVPEPAFELPPTAALEVVVPSAPRPAPQLAQAPETLPVQVPLQPAKELVPHVAEARIRAPALATAPEALPGPVQALEGARELQAKLPTAVLQAPARRDAPESLPAALPPLAGVPERSVSLPQAAARVPGLRDRVESLAGRAGAASATPEAAGTSATAAATTGTAPAAAAANAGGATAGAGAARTAMPAGAGAGARPDAAPGAWTSAKPGDDWGISDRERAGALAGKPGLFDAEGRPRLPPGSSAAAGGGLPPGMVEEEIQDLDRAGTWLKRKNPLPYEATVFDRYWIPGGTLLQEWVRRGIREVQIPIPGTSKKIHCVVSLLQLGGGCGIDDPDMQDQEATARKPPDVPYKPELQEK